ncbi:MAG: LysR family transcriptional regulator [Deltaproteobacteria bacterium]|nr:LysR family transcriptional regulator [Deltaproteobacteria bacterium]
MSGPPALDDLPALALLVDVVSLGSFSKAARRRGLTTSAVSKRVAQLEGRLGISLLTRTTRGLSPTDAGRRLVARSNHVLGELADAELELAELARAPRGVLRIATSIGLGQSHVGRVASEFVTKHPDASVELAIDERIVDLVAGRFDVAVRCGALRDSTLKVKKLVPSKRVLCAAPSYLARRGVPRRPSELAQHACLRHVIEDSGRTWTLGGADGERTVRVGGGFHADNPFVLRDAARAGAGIAFLPSFVVADDVREGTLEVVMPDVAAETGWVYLAFASPRPSRLARAFADFAATSLVERLS